MNDSWNTPEYRKRRRRALIEGCLIVCVPFIVCATAVFFAICEMGKIQQDNDALRQRVKILEGPCTRR